MDIQQAFDATAKVLFGDEIGDLRDFAPYLQEMMLPYHVEKSCISGKDVMVALSYYPTGANFVSQEEIGMLKFPPLSVNEIKDIDSLYRAVGERTAYCGNKLFGRNTDVTEVDNCVDSSSILHSHNVINVKYGAYLSYMREAEHVFGACGFPKAMFSMRVCEGVGASRCFESYYATNLSETYYAFNCISCSNCIFAFNLRSKRNVIGNLQLSKEEYARLKQKLVSEMGDELRRRKRLFSIADIAFVGRNKRDVKTEQIAFDSPVPPKVEEAFRATSRLVLGAERRDVKKFGAWLLKNAMKVKKVKGTLGTPTYKVEGLPVIREIPSDRLVTMDEGMALAAKKTISISKGETPSLGETLSRAAKVAYFSVEFVDGPSDNCVDTPSIFGGSNIYKLWDTTGSKNCAYSTAVLESEHIFGGYFRILRSQFCIDTYDSTSLRGCFEVDNSYSSRDCYFCHNVENCSDCMFCFNVKALQYAVGNQAVGKEEYARLKRILLDYVNNELGERGNLKENIFAIPSIKKK
jgi:hypothetical protein